ITATMYDTRQKELLQNEADTKAAINSADSIANRQFEHGMKVLEISQSASSVFPTRSPEQKRIILSQLFSNLSLDGPFLVVKPTELVDAIADKAQMHRELIEKFEPTKNDLLIRGRSD